MVLSPRKHRGFPPLLDMTVCRSPPPDSPDLLGQARDLSLLAAARRRRRPARAPPRLAVLSIAWWWGHLRLCQGLWLLAPPQLRGAVGRELRAPAVEEL